MERAERYTKCGPPLSNALRRRLVFCHCRGNALRWTWRVLSPPVKTPIIFKCSWNLVTKETLLNYWKISFGVSSFGRSVFFLFRNAIWHGQVVILCVSKHHCPGLWGLLSPGFSYKNVISKSNSVQAMSCHHDETQQLPPKSRVLKYFY